MGKHDRLNMVVTKQSIRYGYRKKNMQDSDMICDEIMLPDGAMKNGAIDDFDLFTATVARLVKKKRWRRKKLAFCLVDDTVFIQEVSIPGSVTNEEAIAYVQTQAGFEFDLPFEQSAVSVDILQQSKKETRVRVYAYPQDRIQEFDQAFRKAGLVPVIADLTSLSVYRYYEQVAVKPAKHSLLVHWNRDGLYITAFDRQKAVFSRHIRTVYDEDVRFDTASEAAGMFVPDITRTLDFYHDSVIKGRARIEELIVSGDFPYLYEVKRLLNEVLDLPVHDFSGKKHKNQRNRKSTRSTRGVEVHLEPESNRDMQDKVKYMDLLGLSRKLIG